MSKSYMIRYSINGNDFKHYYYLTSRKYTDSKELMYHKEDIRRAIGDFNDINSSDIILDKYWENNLGKGAEFLMDKQLYNKNWDCKSCGFYNGYKRTFCSKCKENK